MKKIKKAAFQTLAGIKQNFPIIIGIILLISIIQSFNLFYYLNYLQNNIIGALISDFLGSIFAGNPINSYIIVGEMGDISDNILIASIFLVAWITVGIVQIPGEMYFLGKKFSILRNVFSFIFALIAGYLIYFLYYI